MLSVPEFAALCAALCWSLSGIIAAKPARHVGPMAFVRIRMSIVVTLLSLWLIVNGQLGTQVLHLPLPQIGVLALSGIVGIWLGDATLFMCMNRLGPRRSAILFATNAPMQVILGILFLNETLTSTTFFGCVLVVIGTYLAIVFGKRKTQLHEWEAIQGLLIIGVIYGLVAAFGQAVGALIAKPVLEAGVTAIGATTIRVGAAVVILWLCFLLPLPHQRILNKPTPRIWLGMIASGMLGMAVGMSLLLYALKHGDLGTTAILSSVSTTLMLPLLWIVTKERPAIGAWAGAALVVLGIAAIKMGST
jgi:drug/metabolite transporter (DMT)-like permease